MPPALAFPAFRTYWLGTLASVMGFQMHTVAQGWLAFQLTESPLFLGYVGAAAGIPAIVLNLFGGVLADKVEKRRLIIVTQASTAGIILLLAVLAVTGAARPWHVLAIAFVSGAVGAFEWPARMALFPALLDRSALSSAVALNSAVWQGTRIAAPALAGFAIAALGVSSPFFIAAVGSVAMIAALLRLGDAPAGAGVTGGAVQDILEALRFIWRDPVFSFLIGMTFFNSFFGLTYVWLMPVFAVDVLGVGAGGQGVLLSVGGVGALSVTAWLGTRSRLRHHGLLLIGGAGVSGAAVAAFGVTAHLLGSYGLAIALMVLIGTSNSAYMIATMTALQTMVPDRMRGRVLGFYGMTWSIMPLGSLQAGALASVIGAPYAVAIGGLLVVAFALGPALVNPRIRALDTLVRQAEAEPSGAPG